MVQALLYLRTMLRITKITENGSPAILKLEGKLFDQWVALLEGECRALLRHKQTVLLDFSCVDYIDANGVEMVQSLPGKHVRVVNAPAFIEDLLGRGGKP